MRIFIVIFFFLALHLNSLWSQDDVESYQTITAGAEHQFYPTGMISSLNLQVHYPTLWYLETRAGYNHIRHGDAGIHQDEQGYGFGGGLGLGRKWLVGKQTIRTLLRSDFWRNQIDWRDHINTEEEVSGLSKIWVWQPTLMIGYEWQLNQILVLPTVSFGAEINVDTQGSEVGEGLILLVGVKVLVDL